jgi:hypothetical protein
MNGIAVALAAVIASLLLVGVVSGTPLRHVVQVAPAAAVLILCLRRRPTARVGAMAVFAFWLFCMTLIWLYLLGIARVITGTFSGVEIALTLAIGLASITGLVAAIRARDTSTWRTRLAAFLAAAAVQIGAVWLSVQPMLERR